MEVPPSWRMRLSFRNATVVICFLNVVGALLLLEGFISSNSSPSKISVSHSKISVSHSKISVSVSQYRFEVHPFYGATTAVTPKTGGENPAVFAAAPGHGGSPIGIIIFGLTVPCAGLIAMGIYLSVKRKSKNNGTMNFSTIELGSLQVHPGSLSSSAQLPKLMDKRNGNAPTKDKLKKIWKKLSTMYRLGKKKDEFVVTPLNKENEIQELMPQPMLKSDAVMPSSSTSELDEYKWRREEAEREVHIQREKISSLRKEMQEEVNSMKRQQTQQQQEMEAKQRQMEQMEQQIEFLLSQLQLRRDPPPP